MKPKSVTSQFAPDSGSRGQLGDIGCAPINGDTRAPDDHVSPTVFDVLRIIGQVPDAKGFRVSSDASAWTSENMAGWASVPDLISILLGVGESEARWLTNELRRDLRAGLLVTIDVDADGAASREIRAHEGTTATAALSPASVVSLVTPESPVEKRP